MFQKFCISRENISFLKNAWNGKEMQKLIKNLEELEKQLINGQRDIQQRAKQQRIRNKVQGPTRKQQESTKKLEDRLDEVDAIYKENNGNKALRGENNLGFDQPFFRANVTARI